MRLALWVNTFAGNAIGGVNAVRLVLVALTLPKSVYRYSPLTDQFLDSAASTPAPTVQPALVLFTDALSAAVANVSVKSQFALTLVTARPPVTYSNQVSTAKPRRGRAVNSQFVLTFELMVKAVGAQQGYVAPAVWEPALRK